MDLRGLRYFMVLAQELHFGRAAIRLNISQPPLTQHIKKLEADLGALLFERNNRTVRLTVAGTALLHETRRVIGDIDGLRRVVREAQSGEMGLLRAGFMSSAPFARSQELYGCLARDLPGVSVTWYGLTTSEQIRALRNFQIDLGFLHLPADIRGLTLLPVISDKMVLAVHVSHRFANRQRAQLSLFCDDGFILPPRENAPGLHDLIVSTCQAAGFSPEIPHRARDMLAMIGLVSMGTGVAMVPRWLTASGFPDVRYLQISEPCPTVQLVLAWNPENKSPVLRRSLDALERALTRPSSNRRRAASNNERDDH